MGGSTSCPLPRLAWRDFLLSHQQATLCARRGCMEAIVAQLASESEELHQVPGWCGCGTRSALRGVPPPEAFLLARPPLPWVWRVSSEGHPLQSLPSPSWRGVGDGVGTLGAWALGAPSPSSALVQVVSSILRNLSWRADINSKKVLREVGSMTALMQCVLRASKVGAGWGWGLGAGGAHLRPREEGAARNVQCQPQGRETHGRGVSSPSLGGNQAI